MSTLKKRKLALVTSIALRRDGLRVKVLGRTAVKKKAARPKRNSLVLGRTVDKTKAVKKKKPTPKHDPLENVPYAELQKLMENHFACVSYDVTPDWRSMPETDPPDDD